MTNRSNMIPIAGRLHSVAEGNIGMGADEIYDDTLGITIDQLSTKHASTGTTGDYPYNGMGRIVIPKNMVSGVNTLTQDMFYKGAVGSRVPNTNTIFVIQYDYVLGEDITVPENCVLEFDGGSFIGQKLRLRSTNKIINESCKPIFNGCKTAGLYEIHDVHYSYDNYVIPQTIYSSWYTNLTDADLFCSLTPFETVHLEKDLEFNYVQWVTTFIRNNKKLTFYGHNHSITAIHTNTIENSGSLFGNSALPEDYLGCSDFVLELHDLSLISYFIEGEVPLVWDPSDYTNTNYLWCCAIGLGYGASFVMDNCKVDVYGRAIGLTGGVDVAHTGLQTNLAKITNSEIKHRFFGIEGYPRDIYINNTIIDGNGGICLSGWGSVNHKITIDNSDLDGGIEFGYGGKLTLNNCNLREGAGYGQLITSNPESCVESVTINNCKTTHPYIEGLQESARGYNRGVKTYIISNSIFTMNGNTESPWGWCIPSMVFGVKNVFINNSIFSSKKAQFSINTDNIESVRFNNCVFDINGSNKCVIDLAVANEATAMENALTKMMSAIEVSGVNVPDFRFKIPVGDLYALSLFKGTTIPVDDGSKNISSRMKTGSINFAQNWNGETSNEAKYQDKFVICNGTTYLDAFGNDWTAKRWGASTERPTNDLIKIGYQFFDTTLAKPIWYKGANVWVDATGASV